MACPHRIHKYVFLDTEGSNTCAFWTKNTGQKEIDYSHNLNFCKYNDVNNSKKCPYFFLRNFDVK